MKRSAIMQMFYGERGMHENLVPSEEYFKALDKVIKVDEELEKKTKDMPEIFELIKKFDTALNILNLQSNEDFYLEGFRFGVLIGIDIMTKPSNRRKKIEIKNNP